MLLVLVNLQLHPVVLKEAAAISCFLDDATPAVDGLHNVLPAAETLCWIPLQPAV